MNAAGTPSNASVRGGPDQYSVTRDGQRFLVLRPRDTAAAVERTINVIVNWKTRTEGPER